MQNSDQRNLQYNEEIDLRELFLVLWAGKLKIIIFTLIFSIASALYAISLPNQYKALVLLAPAQHSSGGLPNALGQFGGLAAVAGFNIDNQANEVKIAEEVMKSWSFIDDFIVNNNLAVEIFAAEDWDKKSNKLQIDNSIYDVQNNNWKTMPTSWKLFKRFSKSLQVSWNNETGLLSVSIEHYSPHLAKEWLDMYVKEINSYMQKRQVEQATSNITYLKAQIDKTVISEMQETFYSIMEEQIKNKMLAEASPEYAFLSVSPAMLPEEKSQPRRFMILMLGTILGIFLSGMLVLFQHYTKK